MSHEKKTTCRDLETICYRTALMDKGSTVRGSVSNASLSEVIEKHNNEPNTNISQKGWSRLDVTEKVALLTNFANDYCASNNISNAKEVDELKCYLINAMRNKRLSRASEVDYSRTAKKITAIPILLYNKTEKKFTLKRVKGRVSASAALPKSRSPHLGRHLIQKDINRHS